MFSPLDPGSPVGVGNVNRFLPKWEVHVVGIRWKGIAKPICGRVVLSGILPASVVKTDSIGQNGIHAIHEVIELVSFPRCVLLPMVQVTLTSRVGNPPLMLAPPFTARFLARLVSVTIVNPIDDSKDRKFDYSCHVMNTFLTINPTTKHYNSLLKTLNSTYQNYMVKDDTLKAYWHNVANL